MARLLVNPRSRVIFAGWRTDTATLGRSGWRVSIQENYEYACFEMMLEHSEANLIMHARANQHPMNFKIDQEAGVVMQSGMRREFDGPDFSVVRVFPRDPHLKVYHSMSVFEEWSETKPTMINREQYTPWDFPVFMKKGDPLPAPELIVEPQDVMQLLEQIKRMQAPEQATIRERRRRDTPTAYATILSFPEAA